MCEPAQPENAELAGSSDSLSPSQDLSYRNTRVQKGAQTHKHLFTIVQNSMIHHSLEEETTQLSVS